MNRIELKAISCRGVKSLVLFQKPSLSVAISLVTGDNVSCTRRSDPKLFQAQRTTIDRVAGENPEWDEQMQFDLGADSQIVELFLVFKLRNHGVLLGNNVVGRVRVPVTEIAAEQKPGSFHYVSYQVRTPGDKPNGTLTFAYKMKGRQNAISSPSPVQAVNSAPPPMPNTNTNPATYCPPFESALAYPPPLESNSLYPPPPEKSSIYNPLPETDWTYHPPTSKTNSLYPQLPETNPVYLARPDPTFYNPPQTAPTYPPTAQLVVAYPAVAPPTAPAFPPSPPAYPPTAYYPSVAPPRVVYYPAPPHPRQYEGYDQPQCTGCTYPAPAPECWMDGWDRRLCGYN